MDGVPNPPMWQGPYVTPAPDVRVRAEEFEVLETAPPAIDWNAQLHKWGPWLLAVIIGLAMHYLNPSAPYVPPPLPITTIPPDHTQTITTDSGGKARMVTLPNPK